MKKYCHFFDAYLLLFVCVIIGMLSSCEKHFFVADHLIPEKTRNDIYRLNDTLLTRGFAMDSISFEKYLCTDLQGTVRNYFSMMSMLVAELERDDFSVLNDFYYHGTPLKTVPPLVIKDKPGEGYQFSFIPIKDKMFVSLIKFDNGRLLLLRYGKENKEWKLCFLETGWLTIEGKNVYDWFRSAQYNYEQGQIWNAFREVALMEIIAQSLCDVSYLQYARMNRLTQNIIQRLGKELQDRMGVIQSKPLLLKASWFGEINRFYPRIRYRTSLSLADTLSIRQECESVHRCFWDLTGKDFDGERKTFYEICSTDDDRKVDLELE